MNSKHFSLGVICSFFFFSASLSADIFVKNLDKFYNSVSESKSIDYRSWRDLKFSTAMLNSKQLTDARAYLQEKFGASIDELAEQSREQIKSNKDVAAALGFLTRIVADASDVELLKDLLFDKKYLNIRSDIFIGLGYLGCPNVEEDLIFRLMNGDKYFQVALIAEEGGSLKSVKSEIVEASVTKDAWITSLLRVLTFIKSNFPLHYVINNYDLPGPLSKAYALAIVLENNVPKSLVDSQIANCLKFNGTDDENSLQKMKFIEVLHNNLDKLRKNDDLSTFLINSLDGQYPLLLPRIAPVLKQILDPVEFEALKQKMVAKGLVYEAVFNKLN
ncbi:MAG: hypothetical protein ACRC37_00405 [Lentisphaeria bacterium]